MSKKSYHNLYSNVLYESGQDFLNTQYEYVEIKFVPEQRRIQAVHHERGVGGETVLYPVQLPGQCTGCSIGRPDRKR